MWNWAAICRRNETNTIGTQLPLEQGTQTMSPVYTTNNSHHWLVIIGSQSPVLVILEMFMFSSKLRVYLVMGNFECGS